MYIRVYEKEDVCMYMHTFLSYRYLVRGIYVKIYLGNSFVLVSDHVLCAKDVVLC